MDDASGGIVPDSAGAGLACNFMLTQQNFDAAHDLIQDDLIATALGAQVDAAQVGLAQEAVQNHL